MTERMKEALSEILDDYYSMPSFTKDYNGISLLEFDYYVIHKLSLFIVHENYDFDSAKVVLKKMQDALPAIKRIFVKPIIHLTEYDEVLPVETVKKIDNNTITHISVHSELWDDYDENGIKPVKLLTRTYKDNYSIYENIVFVKCVNTMLSYLRKNMNILNYLLYSSKRLEINLLEKVNHLEYFMAIGKLHTSYAREFGKYYDISMKLYKEMSLVSDTLKARLKRNVYRLNRNYKGSFTLHNSNILHMQKDYHKVYLLLKYFKKNKVSAPEVTDKDLDDFRTNYKTYLKIITIFAIMHFNFTPSEKSVLDFNALNCDFEFKGWRIKLISDASGLIIGFKKNKAYSIRIASILEEDIPNTTNETVLVSPIPMENAEYISICDIESFRRIQRILMRGMTYSDILFKDCMFCGDKMVDIGDGAHEYLCESCRTRIRQGYCKVENKTYYVSDIYNFTPKDEEVLDPSELLHFRNITDITLAMDMVCPYCKKTHKI